MLADDIQSGGNTNSRLRNRQELVILILLFLSPIPLFIWDFGREGLVY